MRYEHRLMAVAIGCIAFAACKKDADPSAPVVTIVAPGNGFDLSVPETLHVVVDVSGETDVDRVLFSISNSTSGFPIIEPFSMVPASNPARLEIDIPITSDLITSGDHTLTVQAASGDASGRDHAELDIIGTPLRLRRVIAISQPDAVSVSIHIVDSTGAISQASTWAMDLQGAAVSSASQTFTVMGSVAGPLMAIRPDGSTVNWQKPNLGNSGIPWFTSLDLCADGRFYAGTTDGVLRGYNATNGAVERICDLVASHRSRSTVIVGDRLVNAQVHQAAGTWRLVAYQAYSGSLIVDQSIDQEVVRMFQRTDTKVLLFGNRDGHGVLKEHDLDGGGGWEPYAWTSQVNDAERVDDNTYIVALADGSIERFTWSNAGSVTIATVNDVRDLALDPVSGLIYMAAGSSVTAIIPTTGQITATYPISSPVHHVLPLLNR